ncbi:MAG: HAD hydrolase-like protein [Lachnospiraceae bacterium]|nr:HAD hydrolase-like protein [Lachnospiraceae bacterium]
MKKYKNLLIDLDGTITDSGDAVISCVVYALEKLGIKDTPYETLRKFIGPSLHDSFTRTMGLDEETANKAIELYRSMYEDNKMYDVTLYDGIAEFMRDASAAGCKVILVTSKPHEFATKIMDRLDLSQYLHYQTGPDMDDPSSDKCVLIEKAVRACDLKKEECVMIGDTRFDIKGAVDAGIDSVGVLYGFGTEEELRETGATYIVAKADDLNALYERV